VDHRPVECLDADEVLIALGSRRRGLDADEVQARREQYGVNRLRTTPRPHVVVRALRHVTHVMALLLWAGSAAALAAGLTDLGVAIALVNVINGGFSFWQEHRAEQATDALARLLPTFATVVRDGLEQQVPAEALVPGDIMVIEEGDRISADARLIDDAGLRVDQSTLTGEAVPVTKQAAPTAAAKGSRPETSDLVFAGTTVSSGRGTAVVTQVGMATEFGRIAGLTQGMRPTRTPLQLELNRLSGIVTIIAVATGSMLAALAVAMGAMDTSDGLVFGLGMVVAFVPEGLLPTVTLSLAMATQRMAERRALVKTLSAVETLGCTTVICTDKTGTLTRNEMTVTDAVTASGSAVFSGLGYRADGTMTIIPDAPTVMADLRDLLVAAALASDARLIDIDGVRSIVGDPTEAALEVAAQKAGLDLDEMGRLDPRLAELPFDPTRRRVTAVNQHGDLRVLHTKGAPLELLALCSAVRVRGVDVPLDDETRRRAETANDDMSRQGRRVIAVAERTLRASEWADERADDTTAIAACETGLTYLGLLAMLDPPRADAAESVARCRSAGIRTIMITGDYGLTAEWVARHVGLVDEGVALRIVTGDQLDAWDDDDLERALAGEVLFARSSPEHKLRVVAALQRDGQVVAVTGDGVNDAPALKRADIGIAMGRSGTDVARDAADMVLLDDSFASIVHAVEEGRSVDANIGRFTSYIFTSNAPEAIPFMIHALSGGRIPLALSVMAILAIDLGTDLVPALALGAEPPDPSAMAAPPRRRDQHLVTRQLLAQAYLVLGAVQAALVMVAFIGWYWTHGFFGVWLGLPVDGPLHAQAVSVALATVVATQIGNLVAHRARRPIGGRRPPNPLVRVGVAAEIVIVLCLVYVPLLQGVMGTGSLPWSAWPWIAAFTPALWVIDRLTRRGRALAPAVV
jgi:Ca2+-transporting ATPase